MMPPEPKRPCRRIVPSAVNWPTDSWGTSRRIIDTVPGGATNGAWARTGTFTCRSIFPASMSKNTSIELFSVPRE